MVIVHYYLQYNIYSFYMYSKEILDLLIFTEINENNYIEMFIVIM